MSRIRTASFALLTVIASGAVFAGPLSPPAGPVAGTMKTIQETEPRVAINSVNTPGNGTSVYRITQPGSYYLTGNIAGEAGKTSIEIVTPNVTIDLNGFTIQGGTYGVLATSMAGLAVRNGVLSGNSSTSLALASCTGARVENVTARGGGASGAGIMVGGGSVVQSCTAFQCGTGIYVGDGSRVSNCAAKQCTGIGFSATGSYRGVTFESCTAEANGGDGFYAGGNDARVERCTAAGNGGKGIFVGYNAVISGNLVSGNGLTGIMVLNNCLVSDNHCIGNGTGGNYAGIQVGSVGATVERNRCNGNDWGIQVDAAVTDVVITGNWCRGNALGNFSVGPGNEFAPVITNPGASNFSGATAFSNFSY